MPFEENNGTGRHRPENRLLGNGGETSELFFQPPIDRVQEFLDAGEIEECVKSVFELTQKLVKFIPPRNPLFLQGDFFLALAKIFAKKWPAQARVFLEEGERVIEEDKKLREKKGWPVLDREEEIKETRKIVEERKHFSGYFVIRKISRGTIGFKDGASSVRGSFYFNLDKAKEELRFAPLEKVWKELSEIEKIFRKTGIFREYTATFAELYISLGLREKAKNLLDEAKGMPFKHKGFPTVFALGALVETYLKLIPDDFEINSVKQFPEDEVAGFLEKKRLRIKKIFK